MTMKAAVYHSFGGPEVLEVIEVPKPKMFADQVRIRIKAAALNPADLGFQAGAVDALVDSLFPVIPGWDVAGIVEEAGAGTTGFKPGDEVIGFVRGAIQRYGSYAEQIAAEPRQLARKPANLDWGQAAGLPLAGLTAYQAVVRALDVREGETVLVHGAAGGVGHLAVQIAAARGASVIGTASESNHDYLRSLGVQPVAYGDGLADRVRALAPGESMLSWTPPAGAPSRSRSASAPPTYGPPPSPTPANTPGPSRSSPAWTKPTWKPSWSWPKPGSCRSA
jgi:NADPH:quinone reductase-like Zn-dependent oxidoreductase